MSLFASWVEPPPQTEKVNYACHHTMGSYFHVSSEEAEIKEWKKKKRMSPLKKKKRALPYSRTSKEQAC